MLTMKRLTKINMIKHVSVIILFIITSLLFFSPVLEGKKIFQQDIMLYDGMAKELRDYREKNGEETYWVNNAFSGMPTYQLGAKYPHNYIKQLDLSLRFLPRPADYLFLYLLGFYILMLSLKVDYRLAVLGALSFGFSTYLIVILGVGHNAKAHAIAYMPLVIAGVLMVLNKKYYKGFILSTIALGLQICANHFQMTYYLMFIILSIGIFYLIESLKNNKTKEFFKSVGILFASLFLAILMNSSILMTTYEYMQQSTRGVVDTKNSPGMLNGEFTMIDRAQANEEYTLMWSYGFFESLNLFIPKIMGGGNHENIGVNSNFYNSLRKYGVSPLEARQAVQTAPMYWGDQPFVEAPAYLGISVFFLFVLSLFITKGTLRNWTIFIIILSLFLSYGSNFRILSSLFIKYFPFYDKFRAVTSIQVIIELCVPLVAFYGVNKFFEKKNLSYLKHLYYTMVIFIVIIVGLYFFKGYLDFTGVSDGVITRNLPDEIYEAVITDRKEIFNKELLRAFSYALVMFLIILAYLKDKLNKNLTFLGIGLVILIDLIPFNRQYVNNDDFVKSEVVDYPYQSDNIYDEIIKDTSDFRVFDLTERTTKPNYFLNSVNGYHGAKLGSYDLILSILLSDLESLSSPNYSISNHILDMLNTKYIIRRDSDGNKILSINNNAYGNAWFIENLETDFTRDEEMIKTLFIYPDSSAVSTDFKENKKFLKDDFSSIDLIEKTSNYIKYKTSNKYDGFAVFSEIFYPHGWNSSIDGVETPHQRVNFLLRGMEIPKGDHVIEFKFEPQIVKSSSHLSLAGTSFFVLLTIFLGYLKFRKV